MNSKKDLIQKDLIIDKGVFDKALKASKLHPNPFYKDHNRLQIHFRIYSPITKKWEELRALRTELLSGSFEDTVELNLLIRDLMEKFMGGMIERSRPSEIKEIDNR